MSRLYSADMATFPRYAIYYVSAPGSDLDRFGAQLLGYDAFSGEDLSFPDGIMQVAPDWRDNPEKVRAISWHTQLENLVQDSSPEEFEVDQQPTQEPDEPNDEKEPNKDPTN